MKYNKILAAVLVLLSCASILDAQDKGFNFKRKVSGIQQEGWHSIGLPPDIFIHCNKDLSDLRLYTITGKDTTVVPYLLKKRVTEVKEQEAELTAINKSKKGDVLYLTFELPKDLKVNFISLEFEETNYFAFVTIEGSEDKKAWFHVRESQRIFSIDNSVDSYQYSLVNFPMSDYRYLRASIRSDKQLTFERGVVRHQQVKEGKYNLIPSAWTTREVKSTKQSVIDISLRHYQPLGNLRIETDNSNNYYRYSEIAVLTDSTKTEKGWVKNYMTINEGYLTSFMRNEFSLKDHMASQLRLTINNLDNPPLRITGVKVDGPAVELIADVKPGTYLFYGNRSLSAPVYDLTHFEEKIPATPSGATLGQEESIAAPPAKISALFENKFWLWGIMIAVIGLLGFFTLRMMKSNA